MDLKAILDAAIAEGEKLGGELLTDLINATHNPTIAQIIYDLASSHVEQAQKASQAAAPAPEEPAPDSQTVRAQ